MRSYGRHAFERGLAFEPDEGWAYSNIGYMLLKSIAERVADASLAGLGEERIASALALERTAVVVSLVSVAKAFTVPTGS